MYILGGGRAGPFTALFGLFFYLFAIILTVAFYIFAILIGILALLLAAAWNARPGGPREPVIRFKGARKRPEPMLPEPPMPTMSRVKE